MPLCKWTLNCERLFQPRRFLYNDLKNFEMQVLNETSVHHLGQGQCERTSPWEGPWRGWRGPQRHQVWPEGWCQQIPDSLPPTPWELDPWQQLLPPRSL